MGMCVFHKLLQSGRKRGFDGLKPVQNHLKTYQEMQLLNHKLLRNVVKLNLLNPRPDFITIQEGLKS